MDYLNGISHLKQSTIRMHMDKILYFDPFGIEGTPGDADIILVSHAHYDHFSLEDIKKLMKKDTVLVMPEEFAKSAVDAGLPRVVPVEPLKGYEVEGLKFNTVPAYNMNKSFHKKESNWVGYIIPVNNITYYFAGDTDTIPEMKDIKADVAFLPVGGTYTMTSSEAVEAANIIKPQIAVPIHFADVVGTVDDAKNFVKNLKSPIRGIILKKL